MTIIMIIIIIIIFINQSLNIKKKLRILLIPIIKEIILHFNCLIYLLIIMFIQFKILITLVIINLATI
jgi:hypothetical protein